MRTSTTNRFFTKTLRALCCVGALTACSAWATVATWQSNSSASSYAPSVTEPLSFAANSNAPTRSATELDEAMAKSFGTDFVSVPTVQFAATGAVAATGAKDVSMTSMTSGSGPGPAPAPEMSALFPIVGLIAAVSCTQILRRRRAAQQSAARIVG